MKLARTGAHRARFAVLTKTRTSQAATMILRPGETSGPDMTNEHAGAEQWLYVVSGSGTARVGHRRVALRAGTLLLIERRERHQIVAGPRSRLVTINIYVPPAYDADGEPLS